MRSANYVTELQEEKQLLDSLWIYLNPHKNAHVYKAAAIELLKALIMNSNKSAKELAGILADHVHNLIERPDNGGQGGLAPQRYMDNSEHPYPDTLSH